MKKFIFTLLCITGTGWALYGQTLESSVQEAIKSGNGSALSSYFHSTIDLNVGASEGSYSKSHAEQVVTGFFSTHTPSSYTPQYSGNSGSDARYFIGVLATSNGSFRVYFLLKNLGGEELIQTLRFESQN